MSKLTKEQKELETLKLQIETMTAAAEKLAAEKLAADKLVIDQQKELEKLKLASVKTAKSAKFAVIDSSLHILLKDIFSRSQSKLKDDKECVIGRKFDKTLTFENLTDILIDSKISEMFSSLKINSGKKTSKESQFIASDDDIKLVKTNIDALLASLPACKTDLPADLPADLPVEELKA